MNFLRFLVSKDQVVSGYFSRTLGFFLLEGDNTNELLLPVYLLGKVELQKQTAMRLKEFARSMLVGPRPYFRAELGAKNKTAAIFADNLTPTKNLNNFLGVERR